jgi:hypothetical protein
MIIYWIASSTYGSSTEGTRSWVRRVPNLAPGISIVALSQNPSLQYVGIGEVIPRQLAPSVGTATTEFCHPGGIHRGRRQHPKRLKRLDPIFSRGAVGVAVQKKAHTRPAHYAKENIKHAGRSVTRHTHENQIITRTLPRLGCNR